MFYDRVIKPVLFSFDAEKVHDFFTVAGENLGRYVFARKVLNAVYGYRGSNISKIVDGVFYRTPVLLSAGFDYNGRLTNILPALSFGGVEVGSITARACAGNPSPRLRRLPSSKSILVNKGLRNDGVDVIIHRLQNKKQEKDFVIGVSIARTNDMRSASLEVGLADFREGLEKLCAANVGDYYTLNISCPNAFGGESFANPDTFSLLLKNLMDVNCRKPVYVKMPIYLEWPDFNDLLRVADKYNIAGVIIGNLSKDRSALSESSEVPIGSRGGFSGAPCFLPSNNLIRKTRDKYGRRFTIIGSGGVLSPKDAIAKFEAGADLIQLITGLIYRGPGFIKSICTEYARYFVTAQKS